MPADSPKQQRFMGADLARVRSGMPSKTGMSEGQLTDFARKPKRKASRRGAARGRRRG